MLHLEAESLEELRIAVCRALDLKMPGTTGPGYIGQTGALPGDAPEQDNFQPPYDHTVKTKPGDTVSVPTDEPVKIRRAKKPAPSFPATDAEAQKSLVNDETPEPAPEEPEGNGADGTPLTPTGLKEMLANEALKKDTIAKLGALFAAGKVKVVRNALDKYGKGAKSFPEIDAAQFPAIAAALDRGDIA
jgi:hypothetical protein